MQSTYTPVYNTDTLQIINGSQVADLLACIYGDSFCSIEKGEYWFESVDAKEQLPVAWMEVFIPSDISKPIKALQTHSWNPHVNEYCLHFNIGSNSPGDFDYGATGRYTLVPMEVAPEVIRVNSNFDEGRVDPVTMYAIPDCDDADIALEAQRAHLDGKYAQFERVTNDLHPGWFGIDPRLLGTNFWDGGTVTISKIDQIDDETDRPETGQIRFYAKWGEAAFEYCAIVPYDLETLVPVNLVQGGINRMPGKSVYGTKSIIPSNAQFYMEGVKAGKITLEWHYQKGDVDSRYRQTFLVATQQSKAEWHNEVCYQIRLQTKAKSGVAVDISTYVPDNGFDFNVQIVRSIYYYYGQLFRQMPEKLMWAGMAKVAGAPIYAGMSDLTEWWRASEFLPGPGFTGDRDLGVRVFINSLLLGGNKKIFADMGWAHRAYQASGISALNYVEKAESGATHFTAWRGLDQGIADNDYPAICKANRLLLEREQEIVIQPSYDVISGIWLRQVPLAKWVGAVSVPVNGMGLANAGEWLSANARLNPIPGGPAFRSVVPLGRLDVYEDRWKWTSNASNGMLEIWTGGSSAGPNFDAYTRMLRNNLSLRRAAGYDNYPGYSFDPDNLPIE